ncbi:MAG: phytanoyl-CoA dioxygenase family protein [Chloroflexota bacterium]
MLRLQLSPEEHAANKMAQDKVDQAINAINTTGFLVLENVVDHDHLDILREKMTDDSHTLIKAAKWGGAGRLRGHLQQGPPPFAPYVFSDIVANPFIIQVTKGVLGEGVFNSFYNGNTNCPGSTAQPLHPDQRHLWANLPIAHPPASLVINMALMDVHEGNGAIELWPGTNMVPEALTDELREQRREVEPPIRGTTKKGDVLIRDMRVWHRGVPNESDELRHMIALVHNIHWRQRNQTLRFNKGCEDAFNTDEIDHNVVFTDEPIDYLFGDFIRP